MRVDGRKPNELRPVNITPGYIDYPEGSVLIEMGKTRVLCAVSVENQVPKWLVGQNQGWLTAEYAMLPRATHTRTPRETTPSARSQEIRRLVGRSLRAAVDLRLIGERTLNVDCDVLQADGGTRTAAITGAYVAVAIALDKMIRAKDASPRVLKTAVAAVSVGIIGREVVLDLNYAEDSRAEVDFNVVMTTEGNFVEVQGTGEGATFSRAQMNQLFDLAKGGIEQLLEVQRQTLNATRR
ncbi:MAG TPA: ribonuclease PH [Anaerolineae bacterium]|nr:ribonuclease PH [Anaerolineae bacterium]